MLHPLEHVGDHQNPLAHTPALTACQTPQLYRPRFAAKKVSRHLSSPNDGVLPSITLPHLEITGSRYKTTPSSVSPVVTKRQSAMSSLRARATIIVLRVPTRLSAVRARYHNANALSF